jgi:transposase
MGAAVRIMRAEHTAADLRALAAKSRDGAQVRRLLALALILEGQPRKSAAEQAGMDRQTLRDWVHRYNDAGVAGLASIRSGGRTALLTAEEMAALKELVIQGPDPETDKVVRWRCIDLREVVTRRFSVTVSERTIGKWLRQMELTRLQPRPFHPKKDEAAQSALKKLRPPGEDGASQQHGRRRQADRDMVPGRGPRGPEGHARLCLGAGWLVPADGEGQSP